MTNAELATVLGRYAAEASKRQSEALGLLIAAIYDDLKQDEDTPPSE